MRPTQKNKCSARGFHFRAISEVHRVADVLNGNRPFEREVFDAKRMVQPDLFRLEMRG